jgi:hypothetical protein
MGTGAAAKGLPKNTTKGRSRRDMQFEKVRGTNKFRTTSILITA